MAEELSITVTSSEGSDTIIETSNNGGSPKYSEDTNYNNPNAADEVDSGSSDINIKGRIEVETEAEVKTETEVKKKHKKKHKKKVKAEVKVEDEIEAQVEAITKTDEEVSEVDDVIEKEDYSPGPGFDRGRTWPLIDPADEEEEEIYTDEKQGDNITPTKTSVKKEYSVTSIPNPNYDAEGVIVEEDTKLDKANIEDQSQKKDYIHDKQEQAQPQTNLRSSKKKNAKDERLQLPPSSTSSTTIESFSACHPSLRNVKGLECIFKSTVSSHPAGSLAASVTFFFFCYCACRTGGTRGGKHWKKRMMKHRRKKRDNDAQGEYAALAVYDELLDSFDDEELSSLYLSRDGDDGSDSSMSTILSEWSGKNADIEMTSLEDE